MKNHVYAKCRPLLKPLIGCISILLISSISGVQAQTSDSAPLNTVPTAVAIHQMTAVNGLTQGYFGDPYPIHLDPWQQTFLPQFFSGTTMDLLQCARPIKTGCFSSSSISIKPDENITAAADAAGNKIFDSINHNIYQAADGTWHMAVTFYVEKKSDHSVQWTVIAHAHAATDFTSQTPPTSWIADQILAGSLATKNYANYDGKYFDDNGTLYLLYSKRLHTKPAHDGIVAQEMATPKKLNDKSVVVMLAPSDANGGFNSEYFFTDRSPGNDFKLIETGNITEIAGKYVMTYSVGDFEQLDYKTGLAFSDTFLPTDGKQYRRVLQEDSADVWGQANHEEVRYLLQSQEPNWPNYVGSQVIGPGVPSIVKEPEGHFLLYFDGFLPSDAPHKKGDPDKQDIAPTHRRPFYIPLEVNVPEKESVKSATDEELESWITTVQQTN